MAAVRTLTSEEVAHYRDQGWLRLGKLVDGDDLERLRAEEERFRLRAGYGARANRNLRVNIQLCARSEPIRRFCTSGPHIPMVAQLLGPNVCLTHQQFVTKLPDAEGQHSAIPWHQDNGYGRLEPMTDVTVWVPLVDTDERNGGLFVIPGSQKQGLLEHRSAGINPVLRESHVKDEGVLVPLAAGEGIAFSGLMVHGSGDNHSGEVRPAFYVRYCDPHCTMASENDRPVLDDANSWMVAGEA